ncbi:uncharacterized protein LOC110990927 [Acanthaster planci]|uniref:Uncharacterized protein LOC110990927 n=1 Tax=Acanthaster planci TaxID=133434 RepID=A0A8B8A2V3_ACAPL|nr:uncharacterized protein LOC110990927 [Acanthaster planci]
MLAFQVTILCICSFLQILDCQSTPPRFPSNQLPVERLARCIGVVPHVFAMEIERLVSIGKEMGLGGEGLREFVREEQERMKVERKAKEDAEREKRAMDIEIRRQERETVELQLKIETLKKEESESQEHKPKASSAKTLTPKLPSFDDEKDDIDSYLNRFERYASAQNWQQSNWAVNLSALLKGKALEVYSRLPVSEASNYDSLKSALLKRYHFTEEGFRNQTDQEIMVNDLMDPVEPLVNTNISKESRRLRATRNQLPGVPLTKDDT